MKLWTRRQDRPARLPANLELHYVSIMTHDGTMIETRKAVPNGSPLRERMSFLVDLDTGRHKFSCSLVDYTLWKTNEDGSVTIGGVHALYKIEREVAF